MESSSRSPALVMNGKDKRNGPSEEVSFQLVLEILLSVSALLARFILRKIAGCGYSEYLVNLSDCQTCISAI